MLRFAMLLAMAAMLTAAGSRAVAEEDTGAAPSAVAFDDSAYYFSTPVKLSFVEAVARAKDELKAIGFGVLWETDFQAKMKEKLDRDIPPYLMLGACHPGLAYDVYTNEPWIGILMPCNVVVREMADGTVEVAIKNSLMLPQATGNDDLAPIVQQVDVLGRQFITAMAAAEPAPPAPSS